MQKKQLVKENLEITPSSGNIFADLGIPDPDEYLTRIELVHEMHTLIKKLKQVQKECQAHGIFINDRGLLNCPKCGLAEDLAIDGRLFTYKMDNPKFKDMGLQFNMLKNNEQAQCPLCGNTVQIDQ